MQNFSAVCKNISNSPRRSPCNNINSNEVFINTLCNCLHIIFPDKKCLIVRDLNYNLENNDNIHLSNFTKLIWKLILYFPVINLLSCLYDSNATVLDKIWTNQHSNQIKLGIILFHL